jgi:hypothetical protein
MTPNDVVLRLITASQGRDDVDPLYQMLPFIAALGFTGDLEVRYQPPSPGEVPTGYRLRRDAHRRNLVHIESIGSSDDAPVESDPALVTVRLEPPTDASTATSPQSADRGAP